MSNDVSEGSCVHKKEIVFYSVNHRWHVAFARLAMCSYQFKRKAEIRNESKISRWFIWMSRIYRPRTILSTSLRAIWEYLNSYPKSDYQEIAYQRW